MSRQMVLRSPTSVYRRQQLLQNASFSSSCSTSSAEKTRTVSKSSKSANCVECCGETTAECAAIVCCFPIGIANLLILAMYKVPAGLWRLLLRKKRRRKLLEKGLLQQRNHLEPQIHPIVCLEDFFGDLKFSEENDKAAEDLEKEMWERFNESGFGRTPSHTE